MKVDVTNIAKSTIHFERVFTWLFGLSMLLCFGGMAVSAQDIPKLEEINFTISGRGLLDPQIWHNPDTKLNKEAKIEIAKANMNVEAAIMKGRPKDKIYGTYLGVSPKSLWEGGVRGTLYMFDQLDTTAKQNVPGCHLDDDVIKEAMRRLNSRLQPAQMPSVSFRLYCLPKCTGFGCGPQNTVTLRNNANGDSQGLFTRSPDIWIRDTSPEALRGSYAGTISDPREQKIALVIHMIGRIAHEANGGEFYYSLGGQKPTFSRALSPLAATSKRMFVAEIFTALVMRNQVKDIDGQRVGNFTPEVMTEYTHLRGLRWWQ